MHRPFSYLCPSPQSQCPGKIYLSIGVNLNGASVQSREFGNVVVTTLTLFFLQLEGDTTNRTARDTLHQVGRETGDLVAKTLGGDDSNLVADTLVGLEVQRKTGVVLFNKDTGGLLDGLGSIIKM